LALGASSALAQTVNFSLNVFYTNPTNTASGGTWELVAKSSDFGIAGVDLHLLNIQTATLRAPRATVNGNDPAGFNTFVNATFPNFIIGQTPNGTPAPTDEEGLFYGVGQFANGAPNYPMQPMGTMSEGPSITSLTSPVEIPWADAPDPFGDANWNTAARLLSGTFATSTTPAFAAGNDANVFTSLPLTADAVGGIAAATTITTLVRTNFAPASADYNKNGIVDAADYVIWRKQDGTSVPPASGADGNGDGMVNQADYTFWRSRFGLPFGAGSGADLSTSAVPEPASLVIGAAGAMLLVLTRRRRRMKNVAA
jgi:hypothetical protein